jgi:hypothetical protein
MKFKFGTKTFSFPITGLPNMATPYLSFLKALRIPLPKILKVGGAKSGMYSLIAVAVGFGAILFIVDANTDTSPTWPEAGAFYTLPDTVGEKLPPDTETPTLFSQTLQINAASSTRLMSITLNNLDMGKAELSECLQIKRDGSTVGYLYLDEFIMTGVSAPSFDLSNSETGELVVQAKVDGHTMAATIDSTISEQTILSQRGAGNFTAENSVVDRVIINLMGDATVGKLILTNVKCSNGSFDLDYVKAGKITIDNTSMFGTGSGINSADFVISNTTKVRTVTDNLVDTPITVR